jgi:hypothetical protein
MNSPHHHLRNSLSGLFAFMFGLWLRGLWKDPAEVPQQVTEEPPSCIWEDPDGTIRVLC